MRLFAVLAVLSLLYVAPAGAAVRIGQRPAGTGLTSTGFFGGVKNGNTFTLVLSEGGGTLYYRVSPALIVAYKGERIRIDRLPLKTPVKVSTVAGLVVAVEPLGGGR